MPRPLRKPRSAPFAFVSLSLLAMLAGCALTSPTPSAPPAPLAADSELAPFSANPPGALPRGWRPQAITRAKKPTEYQLVDDGGVSVLHAHAAASASALMRDLDLDPAERPWLRWRWKAARPIHAADNRYRDSEDSPVRIVLAFDGDKGSLPFTEQILFETGRLVVGRELPYATLVYIWENRAPVGSVIAHTRTGQVKMVVAASGADGIGQWRSLSRNIVDDYRRAFGQAPGRLIGIGVMSDTDNTGETADAWYGDIELHRTPPD